MEWIEPAAGFTVGTIVGLTGVGGGALMTPILVLLFGYSPLVAVGTDLWFAAITKLFGGAIHQRQGSVDWEVLRRLMLGSLPASICVLVWLNSSGREKLSQEFILTVLGVVLLMTAISLAFRNRLHQLGRAKRSSEPVKFKNAQGGLTVAAGAMLGILVTLTSIGAGALGVVVLAYLYPFRLKPATLVGTDIVHAIPLAIVAGTGHLLLGNVDVALLGKLLAGSIPGVVMGSLLCSKIPDSALRVFIAVLLAVVGLKLIVN